MTLALLGGLSLLRSTLSGLLTLLVSAVVVDTEEKSHTRD